MRNLANFSFTPIAPRRWLGRYARIPGDGTAFHVRLIVGRWWPTVDWTVGYETAQCPMVDVDGAADLADAVNRGKRFLRGSAGGTFLVNEYGQVLVPSQSGDGNVAMVGECAGSMTFQDLLMGRGLCDLTDDQGLMSGAKWELPYIGIVHQLSQRNEIYFWHQGRAGSWKVTPRAQDGALVNALRGIRPHGAVRFIATFGGLILTKVPIGGWKSPRWEPRFVGRVDYKRWFPKEV